MGADDGRPPTPAARGIEPGWPLLIGAGCGSGSACSARLWTARSHAPDALEGLPAVMLRTLVDFFHGPSGAAGRSRASERR